MPVAFLVSMPFRTVMNYLGKLKPYKVKNKKQKHERNT